jgi:adenine/guanine phosphoribosyltransferase-like PRPP-binding protein
MNSFLRRVHGEHKFQLIQVPMSAYVTIERIKDTVEAMYYSKRRNLLEPRDKERPVVLIIDDVHL